LDKASIKAPDAFRTISEVAQDLDLPQHVLRFWETRFAQIKPMKRGGGRRYYRPEDVDLLRGIRLLLYAEGFTIRGVQRLLKENGTGFVVGVGQSGSVQGVKAQTPTVADEDDEPGFSTEEEGFAEVTPAAETAPSGRAQVTNLLSDAMAAADIAEPQSREFSGPALSPRGFSKEGRRRIEAALADLLEAKRLLDQVR
jgi:DNA-binding transcriptional MerR regulator